MQYWSVSGCVNNLLIKNNLFENIRSAIDIFVQRPLESGCKHKNISIIGNTFKNCKNGILADCVDGLIIKENVFENVENTLKLTNCTNSDVQ